jgi:two-component system sensor histidine kinase/response regulator
VPRNRRVLIVDDNRTSRLLLAAHLEQTGYSVAAAADGMQALMLLRHASREKQMFDAVLIDYRMPNMNGAELAERIRAEAELDRARLILLTSLDGQVDMTQMTKLGFVSYLRKPVRPHELVESVHKVIERDGSAPLVAAQPAISPVEAAASRLKGAKVLLVEDNIVNQKVAMRYLARMGCDVTLADNGAAGVTAYERATFDLVLMDIQMPVLDGYSAARHIRKFEEESSGRRTPIIAVTADALSGQRERCMAAGMDDVLTKPLDIALLTATLQRLMPAASTTAPAGASHAEPNATAKTQPLQQQSSPAIDLTQLGALTDGDLEFTSSLTEAFESSSDESLGDLRTHAAKADGIRLRQAAHKLAGASASVHATRLREYCKLLELRAEQMTADEIAANIERIAAEVASAREELRRHLQSTHAA